MGHGKNSAVSRTTPTTTGTFQTRLISHPGLSIRSCHKEPSISARPLPSRRGRLAATVQQLYKTILPHGRSHNQLTACWVLRVMAGRALGLTTPPARISYRSRVCRPRIEFFRFRSVRHLVSFALCNVDVSDSPPQLPKEHWHDQRVLQSRCTLCLHPAIIIIMAVYGMFLLCSLRTWPNQPYQKTCISSV